MPYSSRAEQDVYHRVIRESLRYPRLDTARVSFNRVFLFEVRGAGKQIYNPESSWMQAGGEAMHQFRLPAVAFFLAAAPIIAQTPISNGKPTEKVVIQYEKFVEDGAFLTADGWQRAGRLFEQVSAFPPNGKIYLMDTGGAVGENWQRGNEAEVETKWTDYFGSIDSSLRYKAPQPVYDVAGRIVQPAMTVYRFRLLYSGKCRKAGKDGKMLEIRVPWEWRVEDRMARWATVNKAIDYVAMMRQRTTDPVIKRNADKTLAALRRIKASFGCGRASAC
jgi:hypothetical protein